MVPPGRVRLHVYEIKWIRKSLEDDLGTTLKVNIPKQITNVEENTNSALPQRTENGTGLSIVDQRHDTEGTHRLFFRRFFLNELDTTSTIWSGGKPSLQPHENFHGLKDTTNILKQSTHVKKQCWDRSPSAIHGLARMRYLHRGTYLRTKNIIQ